jgi:acyl transferase domain-containing protein/NAD(P)H-dependent flavin oxidoreductase YrpB (nitropropane dioxygenase family)/NAD(P)-dependent dehydrogenase (short-subunit alcohol dehydrogenase family)/acyl carrier protein
MGLCLRARGLSYAANAWVEHILQSETCLLIVKLFLMKRIQIFGITPFEHPDAALALALEKAGAFPVLHLGRDKAAAAAALKELSDRCKRNFGICLSVPLWDELSLPDAVDLVILPFGLSVTLPVGMEARLLYQVHSIAEARQLKEGGGQSLIITGNESGGLVGDESTFILFQRIRQEMPDMEIFVQGGIGLHSGAALSALGAAGVVLDSQLALFDECRIPKELKRLCQSLNGHETKVIDHYRVLVRPNSPALPEHAGRCDLVKAVGPLEVDKGYIPMGQDITISTDLVRRYKKLDRLVFALREAAHGSLKQAKVSLAMAPGNALAAELHIKYPIAQGPMTRVSDVPAFARSVAEAGGLPFVALSLLKGEAGRSLIRETRRLMVDRVWGVGILGFVPQELRDEQMGYILEEKPPVVLIAGGRPSQAKPLEKAGIRTFLHVPSVVLLDVFIKEGGRRYVFEGRECGGHVGPLSSLVLWEKQIVRLLEEEHPEEFDLLFAGGIHDGVSAAMVSIMAAPLVARGARVGVLMGTAYLYTEEAVSTGAIVSSFQQQAIAHADTVLLETAPGHETRCLNSAYADLFHAEKERLRSAGSDKQEIWSELEKLNVGRLRIAAKGLDRKDDALVNVSEQEQLASGMYMIGQVAALKDRILSIRELHEEVGEGSRRLIAAAELPPLPQSDEKALDIAVIGMACIYPGARNIEEYWRNIVLGKDCITEVPDERWNKELYYDAQSMKGDMSPSKWGGFIPKIDFDPMEFGIPPQSLAAIEPSQLLSLLVARQALEHAGYAGGNSRPGEGNSQSGYAGGTRGVDGARGVDGVRSADEARGADGAGSVDGTRGSEGVQGTGGTKRVDRENISVIIGAEGGNDLANNYGFRCLFRQVFGEMPPEVDQALPRMTEDSFPGVLANVIAGRITNRLDLGGRNYTVDAACASSMAAIDLACQELILEKSDMVLAGAVDLHNGINDYLMFSSTHALSRNGRCMTFDSSADGIALGEGVAMLVLKRREDALRDGDTIYAVIKGVGGSSDGKSLGLTAPRKAGQERALERAYAQAGLSLAKAGLIEAHGTGTVVGDRTELSALTELMILSGATPGQTHLGSVKTQIGHTKCAAGMAGFIKAVLAVYHGVKPPTLHLKQPNNYYRPGTSPFAFHTEAALWNDPSRVAGVSAFGFGGTNFHAVIENEGQPHPSRPVLSVWPTELFVFRGDTYEEAMDLLKMVRSVLINTETIKCRDLAYTLALYSEKKVQLSIVADCTDDLLLKLDLVLSGAGARGLFPLRPVEGKTAFLFPGQGSQHINMARELFVLFPVMRKLLRGYPQYEKVLFPDAAFDEAVRREQKEHIRDTQLAQPLLGIVDHAIASLLREWGIEADMVAGHSYGELPALCYAGVFDDAVLVPLSERRSRAILDATGEDKGTMIAVNVAKELLEKLLPEGCAVYPVNHNSPKQWVLAGSTTAIESMVERLKEEKLSYKQLEVACAFHSPLLAGSRELFLTAMQDIKFREASLPVWSNTTAGEYPADPAGIRERLADHLVKPVLFSEEIEQMYAAGARIFVEVGPGKTLSGLTRNILGRDELVFHTEEAEGLSHLLSLAGAYMATGRTVRLEKLFEGRDARLLDLRAPDKFKRSSTAWIVNGQMAVPAVGALPAHGAPPIVKPLSLSLSAGVQPVSSGEMQPVLPVAMGGAERMVEEYLKSMQFMIQAQRDVLMAYLGQVPAMTIPVSGTVMPAIPGGQTGIAAGSGSGVPVGTRAAQAGTGMPMGAVHAAGTAMGSGGVAAIAAAPGAAQVVNEVVVVDIRGLLLKIVSEKTGYPPDMLNLDSDMEADLSIDSIKRMEIIAALKMQLGGGRTGSDTEEDMTERLASVKTLQGLINLIGRVDSNGGSAPSGGPRTGGDDPVKGGYGAESGGGGYGAGRSSDDPVKGADGLVEEARKIIEEGFVHPEEAKLIRLRIELSPSDIGLSGPELLKGKRFAITDDGGEAALILKRILEEYGAFARVISAKDILENYDGLILLETPILKTFALVKKLDANKARWIYALSIGQHIQGYSGFLKSLDKEWENTQCRAIHLDTQLSSGMIAKLIVDELLMKDDQPEVNYHGESRKIKQLVPAALTIGQQADIRLGPSSVILVLGGAQGITAELMIGFAKEYPCRYVLVGRSADPRASEDAEDVVLTSRDAIREALIRLGQGKSPVEIERKVEELYKRNQILKTITAIEQSGATVDYHPIDCRDEEKLSALIKTLYRTYGRIDGVVHGAGLLEDKLFRHKTPESFERVFATKVNPLRVLSTQLRSGIQFVVLFSSVSSVYGNRGQTDYAAANSVMDQYALELKKNISGKVLAINWGPWKGAGMVSPVLEREYERRGISLIPLTAGMELFLNELKYGKESQVLIMAGQTF